MITATSLKNKRILVTGGSGFLGHPVVSQLMKVGASQELISIPRSHDYDLRDLEKCRRVVRNQDIVIHMAARVGEINLDRDRPAELFYDNLVMGTQLIHAAYEAGVSKFICVGTISSYPKFTSIPFKETELWQGYPEETDAPYGIAKKALLVQLQAYRQQYGFKGIYLLPANLYGPQDNFEASNSRLIPTLIRKVHKAQQNGEKFLFISLNETLTCEFIYSEDAARGIVMATLLYDDAEPINLGTGSEVSISDLMNLICKLMDFRGEIVWESNKPNDQLRRCLDTKQAKILFDFEAQIDLEQGLATTIAWYKKYSSVILNNINSGFFNVSSPLTYIHKKNLVAI